MKSFSLFSITALFVLISAILMSPSAFADHSEVTVVPDMGSGSSTDDCVETEYGCYIPGTATVDLGGVVIFSNTDSAAHTWSAGSAADGPTGEFDTSMVMAGNSYEWTADVLGEIPYFCMVHPWMDGLIIVQEAGAEEAMEETHDEEEMHVEDTMEEKVTETMMIGDVDVTMSPSILGSANAPITIIEFGDYQCPKCDQWFQNEKPTITADYIDTDKAKLYFVDFPFLGMDSDNAANASYCANDQGKFWEYHGMLYNNQGGINEGWANIDSLKQFAADLGLDTAEFDACVDSNTHKDTVDYNRKVGASNGVEGTPVFIIIGSDGTTQRIDGPQSSSIFAGVIDTMLGEPMQEAMAETEEEAMMEEKEEMMETETDEKEGGGCLIATAAYGTELAPQVQFLREIRDNTVMSTASGAAFMTGFNQLYYSFSPTIANMERENPMFQEAVRAFITPMISTLSILSLAEDGNESQVFGLGASIIALNLGMYIVAPALVGFAVSKRLRN